MSSASIDTDLVTETVAAALQRWPGVRVRVAEVRKHIELVGAREGEIELHGEELCLAAACAAGDPGALRVFENEYVAALSMSLARFRTGFDFNDELRQELRCRLLAPPEPRIATYAGTGPLLAWLRVAAVRLGLNLQRTERRRSEELIVDELLCDVPVAIEQAERSRFATAFVAAVREAFDQLTLKERNLLRLHYADGLGIQELAQLERVHRATVARRLAEAKQKIFDLVEIEVRERLKLSPSEFRSVVGLLNSYLEASLSGLFPDAVAVP